jgi:hypothetical protein
MSKGYKPRDKDRPPVQTIDAVGSGNGGGGDEIEVKSWQFSLVDKTAHALSAKVGTRVTGFVNGFDVEVRNGGNNYGFAPKRVSLEIVEAMNGEGTLIGTVTSVKIGANHTDTDVWVNLVLK